jgi:kumamolisin
MVPTAAGAAGPALTLSNNVTPGLGASDRLGAVDGARPMQVQLALNLRDRAGLDDVVRRVSTPGSSEYGNYLSAAEVESRFGPTAADVKKASDYLTGGGLTVTGARAGSFLVNATGPVRLVEAAMHTTIGSYQERSSGRHFFANDVAPSLPADIGAVVHAVHGLDNHAVRKHAAAQPNACCDTVPYGPAQLRAGYNFTAAPLASLTGTGQTMGLMELDTFQQANINSFDSNYSITPPAPTVQTVDGGVPSLSHSNGGEIEVELDIEVMQGIAHGAGILVFEAPNNDLGVNDAYSCMWNPNATVQTGVCPNMGTGTTAASNSTSWGLCEPDNQPGELGTLDNIFVQAAATGHSIFAASGDSGAFDCRNSANPSDGRVAVDSPASDPYVTGTGGTRLLLNSGSSSYFSETGWSGAGGGVSSVFGLPDFQRVAGVSNSSSNGKRQVPDVALDSDPGTGYNIYTCNSTSGTSCVNPLQTGFHTWGGTSAAAPGWAAFTALYNQYAASVGRPNLGYANPALYQASQCAQLGGLHDVTSGARAGAGWDYTTGLGTFNAANLATTLVSFNTTACPSGYTLDGWGGVHQYGTTTPVSDASHAYWYGWNIARGIATCPNNANRGYTVDGYGGVHPFGNPTPPLNVNVSGYWGGWDIARGIVVTQCGGSPGGYTLDGWGGVHEFGSAPPVSANGYWPGWDITRGIAACPDASGGYTLDGWGGVHGFGGQPDLGSSAYWQGWDIARGIVLLHCTGGIAGYTLDGWGGIHQFGNTGAATFSGYWPGWDIARGITVLKNHQGGYVVDGYGGVHPWAVGGFGLPPSLNASGYFGGWDIMKGVSSGA